MGDAGLPDELRVQDALAGFNFAPITTEDEGIVAGAVVMMKIVHDDGSISLQSRWDGVTWLERPSMLRAALHAENETRRDFDD